MTPKDIVPEKKKIPWSTIGPVLISLTLLVMLGIMLFDIGRYVGQSAPPTSTPGPTPTATPALPVRPAEVEAPAVFVWPSPFVDVPGLAPHQLTIPAPRNGVPDGIFPLNDWQVIALWPEGYTDPFYEALSQVTVAIQLAPPDDDGSIACYVTGDRTYMVQVVRNNLYDPKGYHRCLAHEMFHILDAQVGYPSSWPEFQQAVWASIAQAEYLEATPEMMDPEEDQLWIWMVQDRISTFPGIMSDLSAGQWGGWAELYTEIPVWASDYVSSVEGMLQAVPPQLRPFYEDWLPWNNAELLPQGVIPIE